MSEKGETMVERRVAEAIRNKAEALSLSGGYEGKPLPGTLLDIPALRRLRLENFNDDIPAWLAELPFLESLELEECGNVGALLPGLWKLKRLRKLKLSFVDGLTTLPDSLAALEHLKELHVDGAEFESFPPVIAALHALESFSFECCECELREVFDSLSGLPRLKKLRFTHEAYEGDDYLPESFCRLSALEEIHFNTWNRLRELPECVGNMHALRVLNLSNEDYGITDVLSGMEELPKSLGKLRHLEVLDLYGLQNVKRLPPEFDNLTGLKELDTMLTGLEELHLAPGQWGRLEKLRMHGPLPDFRRCRNLKEFAWLGNGVAYLRFCNAVRGTRDIVRLPHIEALGGLESLRLSGGTLESTDFLTALTNLRRLHLSCNFEKFPVGFENLRHLEEIDLFGATSLESLPEELGRMPSLRRLSLTACGVKELPQSVRERNNLTVYMSNCPVTRVE